MSAFTHDQETRLREIIREEMRALAILVFDGGASAIKTARWHEDVQRQIAAGLYPMPNASSPAPEQG